MAIKVVILFELVTRQRAPDAQCPSGAENIGYTERTHVAGWSESCWWDTDNVAALMNALRRGVGGKGGLLPTRAGLLPASGAIIGVRLYKGGAGRGQSYAMSFPGFWTIADVPQMALLCKTGPVDFAVTRRFVLRGIPDNFVHSGEFCATRNFATGVAEYFKALSNFSFLANDPDAPKIPVFSISATGLVTAVGATQPFFVNQLVTINRTLDAHGDLRSFSGHVASIGPLGNQFTLANWNIGATTGGTAATKGTKLFDMSDAVSAVSRVVVRKVGRPFEQYRGRRSKSRKIA